MNADDFLRSPLSVVLVFGIIPAIVFFGGGLASLGSLAIVYGAVGMPICMIVCAAAAP